MRKRPRSVCRRFARGPLRTISLSIALVLVTLGALKILRTPGALGGSSRPLMPPPLAGALGRRQCPSYKPGELPSLAFVHIPKTAGLLLVETLQKMMPADGPGRWCIREGGRDLPEVYSTCSAGAPPPEYAELFNITGTKFYSECSGFAAHQDVAFFEAVGVDPSRTVLFTALRNPVDRVISDYYYSLKANASWLQPYLPRNDTDFSGLQQFVIDNLEGLNNIGSQMLAGARHCDWPGTRPNPPMGEVLEHAKHNLERMCVILLTEHMDESLRRLSISAGWSEADIMRVSLEREAKAKEIGGMRVNATPRPEVPEDIRTLIAHHNAIDMQLYDFAVQLFHSSPQHDSRSM